MNKREKCDEEMSVFIYGTAGKGHETGALVFQALQAGFRAIDTAALPRHCREDLVGQAVREALAMGTVQREDIFVNRALSRHATATATDIGGGGGGGEGR